MTSNTLIQLHEKKSLDQLIVSATPYTSLFREALEYANQIGASDIHFHPHELGLDILHRINGVREHFKTLGKKHTQAFITEVKRLTRLSIAKRGKTDDAQATYNAYKLKLRSNALPSLYDDEITCRVIDLKKDVRLHDLGYDKESYKKLQELLTKRHGLCLVVGKTGSGKSSALCALLKEVDAVKKKIITMEHPVEYPIPGATQVNIKDKGLNFADALRAAMRQDPDILYPGEIRDSETAQVALQASATGQLVFSTMHCAKTTETVRRLKDLGVSDEQIRVNLQFVAAQRLVRLICPHCAIEVDEQEKEAFKSWAKVDLLTKLKNPLFKENPKGCSKCRNGVIGRMPVIDMLDRAQVLALLNNKDALYQENYELEKKCAQLAIDGKISINEAMNS